MTGRAPRTDLSGGYQGLGRFAAGLSKIDRNLQQARLPLTGAIQNLGSEFGNAVKQVLLFGTAYKALAFIVDLPNQALAAATSLQTFRNQLEAVTGSAAAADQGCVVRRDRGIVSFWSIQFGLIMELPSQLRRAVSNLC